MRMFWYIHYNYQNSNLGQWDVHCYAYGGVGQDEGEDGGVGGR